MNLCLLAEDQFPVQIPAFMVPDPSARLLGPSFVLCRGIP